MSPKIEILCKRTQEVRKFFVERITQDQGYVHFDQALKELGE
jgi:hypothetical protein